MADQASQPIGGRKILNVLVFEIDVSVPITLANIGIRQQYHVCNFCNILLSWLTSFVQTILLAQQKRGFS